MYGLGKFNLFLIFKRLGFLINLKILSAKKLISIKSYKILKKIRSLLLNVMEYI
jgi:hypothetical protein